jgi:hypothetical protein
VEAVSALGSLALVVGASGQRIADADSLDDQDLVFHDHVAYGFRREPSVAGVDPARLQRATQSAGESTGRRGDHVVKGGRVVRVLAGGGAIVLAHLIVGAEEDRLRLERQVGLPDRAALANDSHT